VSPIVLRSQAVLTAALVTGSLLLPLVPAHADPSNMTFSQPYVPVITPGEIGQVTIVLTNGSGFAAVSSYQFTAPEQTTFTEARYYSNGSPGAFPCKLSSDKKTLNCTGSGSTGYSANTRSRVSINVKVDSDAPQGTTLDGGQWAITSGYTNSPAYFAVATPVTGPKGDTGARGPAGAKGETGATGAEGPKGPAGAKGEPGAEGPKGATGSAGAKGDPGAEGPKGIAGPKGETGAEGPAGPKGAKGDTGAEGPKGPAGPEGSVGPKGETGAEGPKGPAGAKREPGAEGARGTAGPKGESGATGPRAKPDRPDPRAPPAPRARAPMTRLWRPGLSRWTTASPVRRTSRNGLSLRRGLLVILTRHFRYTP